MDKLNIGELRKIQRFLIAIRGLTDQDMTVQRLNVLLEVAIRGEVDQGAVVKAANLRRSATSKNVASWSRLTPLKKKGPGFIEQELDPMNLRTRILKITEAGLTVLNEALRKAKIA